MHPRTAVLALFLLAAQVYAALAADPVKLFKVISSKDEVIIGLTTDELRSFGNGPDIDTLAHRLVEQGQVTVWQYAVRKDQSGALQQAPLKRVAVFRNDTLRIEPYASPLPIVPPAN